MYVARTVRYEVRGRLILDGVDLRLAPGKIVTVVGPNGAGKSTLLKIMAGERQATGGSVTLDDRDLAEWKPEALARRRAVLPQSIDVVFPYLVSEVVALGLSPRTARSAADAVIGSALSAVGLGDFGSRVYGTLSGGEKQRVQFARVLVQVWSGEQAYLLLDEPNASLDLSHQLLILRLARAHAESGGGVMMVLHDLNLAAMIADEMIALKDGCRIAAGPPEQVITDPLIAALYGVHAKVRGVPDGPFVLPQSARLPG